MELGITMRTAQIRKLLTCLDEKASFERIQTLHGEVVAETISPVWRLEMEPLLTEFHGAWRYEGRREVLLEDLTRSAGRYAVMYAMDALLTDCGFPVVRTRPERLDDAAWYAVPREER
jgi:hypothetical protein